MRSEWEKEWIQAEQIIQKYKQEYETEVEENYEQYYKEFQQKFSPEYFVKLSAQSLLESIFAIGEKESIETWWKNHRIGEKERQPTIVFCSKENIFVNKEYLKKCSKKEFNIIRQEIWECWKAGFSVILRKKKLESIEDYRAFDRALWKVMGVNAYHEWFHEYLYWMFPDEFSIWHSEAWQKHILFAYGIHPDHFFYGRSGQISLLIRKANITMQQFCTISYAQFGEVRSFFRIGTSNKGEDYFSEWKENHIAAIGWSDLGPLDQYIQGDVLNKRELREKLQELYYPGVKQLASRKAKELANFYNSTNTSIFVAMRGEQLLAFGDQVGAYYYNESVKFSHRKSIQWHCCFQAGEKLPNKSEGLRTSFYELKDEENLHYLYQKYYSERRKSKQSVWNDRNHHKRMNDKKIERVPRDHPLHPLNQILYGPPGTGKTYSLVEYALAIIENRRVNDSKQTIHERKEQMKQYETFVQSGQVVFTTFHQSYGYEEFVQGIRPNLQAQTISFQKTDGIFKQISDRALQHPEKNYVLIIDEINRGNISKIFGELITLLEEDKRIGEINELIVTLPSGDSFAVPNNLYLIGTMNSADQSISIMDTALRRRFQFIEMPPQADKIENKQLRTVFQILNRYLKRELRNTDLLIGHSFFMNRTEMDLEEIFNQNIIPLLYEYFYNEEEKIRQALECLEKTAFEIDSCSSGRIRIRKKDKRNHECTGI